MSCPRYVPTASLGCWLCLAWCLEQVRAAAMTTAAALQARTHALAVQSAGSHAQAAPPPLQPSPQAPAAETPGPQVSCPRTCAAGVCMHACVCAIVRKRVRACAAHVSIPVCVQLHMFAVMDTSNVCLHFSCRALHKHSHRRSLDRVDSTHTHAHTLHALRAGGCAGAAAPAVLAAAVCGISARTPRRRLSCRRATPPTAGVRSLCMACASTHRSTHTCMHTHAHTGSFAGAHAVQSHVQTRITC